MKFTLLTVAAFAALVSAATPKTLKLGFTQRINHSKAGPNPNAISNPLKIPTDPQVVLKNEIVEYVVEIGLGTPAQPFSVQIDTGSSDLWVKADGSKGAYNSTASHTYEDYKPGEFYISYGDYTSASGDWVKDTITVGDSSIPQFIFAAASQTDTDAVFGIGYNTNEASHFQQQDSFEYDNFPIRLAKSGYINTPAFSLYLDSLQAKTGNVLFGAVDTSKISGGLAILPIIPDTPGAPVNEFQVTLDSVDFGSTNALDQARVVLLDAGTTLTYLPTATFWTLFNALGLYWTTDGAVASQSQLDKWANEKSAIEYTFQGKKVSVALTQLFTTDTDTNGNPQYVTLPDGSQELAYGFLIADNGSNNGQGVLGDSFLRSVYVAYDLHNNVVGLGQADYTGGEEKIEAISSGGIPSATKAPSAATWSTDNPITTQYATYTTTASVGPTGA